MPATNGAHLTPLGNVAATSAARAETVRLASVSVGSTAVDDARCGHHGDGVGVDFSGGGGDGDHVDANVAAILRLQRTEAQQHERPQQQQQLANSTAMASAALQQQQQQEAACNSGSSCTKTGSHNCYLPVLKPDVLLNDRGLFTLYCFVKDFIGTSGTSAVAIDNKIEQAMDLVKSHLMIAVREEVEVLKEKISELMDKINQLEVENSILKANMSQETLQQLQMQTQLQIAGSTPLPQIAAAPQQTVVAATSVATTSTSSSVTSAVNTVAAVASATAAATPTASAAVAVNALTATAAGDGATQESTNVVQTPTANAATNGGDAAVSAITTNGPMP